MNARIGGRSRSRGRKISILAAIVGMVLAAIAVLIVTPTEVWAGQQFVRVLSSSQTVSAKNPEPTAPASYVDANGNPIANLKAARNEFESFQVYVKADSNGIANLRVDPGASLAQIDPATGNTIAGGASIPAKNLTFYREHFINIGDDPGEYVSDTEGGLGEWADGLIPEKDYIYGEDHNAFPYTVPANGRAVAWVDVLVPENQPPGFYQGTIVVKSDPSLTPSGGGTVLSTIPVRIEVKNFGIPSESTLDSAFMMNHQYHSACYGYKASTCDTEEKRWKLYSQFARVGLENRISIPSPWGMAGLSDGPSTASGSYFEKYALPLITGMDSSKVSGDPGQSRLNGARLTSVAAYEPCVAQSDSCLPAWKTLMDRYNFKDRFFLYTCDEPNADAALWTKCMNNAAEARSVDPAIRTLITGTPQRLQTYGDPVRVDTIVPLVNHVDAYNCCGNPYVGDQRNDPSYTNFLAADYSGTGPNALWMYTSNMSYGSDDNSNSRLWDGFPGYAIDEPDTQARAMGWMSFYYGMTGELYYQTTDALSTAWTNQYNLGGNGDGNLFYPGISDGDGTRAPAIGGTHDIPIESIRLKKIRDGREDYEYMHKLKQQGKEAQAMSVIASAFPDGYGDKNYQTLCPAGTARPTSPNGGCGDSAMYTTIDAASIEAARLRLMNLVNPEPLETTPPTAVVAPADGAPSVPVTDSVTATFNEAMDASTISGVTFSLKKTATAASVPASVIYDANALKATLDPTSDLETGTQYTATLSGAKDASGNALASKSWSFTTASGSVVGGTCLGAPNTRVADDQVNTVSGIENAQDTVDARGGNDTLQSLSNLANVYDRFCGGAGDDTFKDEMDGGGPVLLDGGNDSAGVTDIDPDIVSFRGWNSPPVGTTIGVDVRLSGGNPIAPDGGQAEAGGTIHALYNFSDVEGSHLDDNLEGNNLNNSLYGYEGNDTITGGTGGDYLNGGAGNDTIYAADGVRDTVNCGDGTADGATVDAVDVVSNCETDTVKPVITPVSPKPGADIHDRTPTIRANVSDNVTNLAKSNIKLYMGTNLISPTKYSYNIDTNALIYNSPRLSLRKKTVKIVATDAAGNVNVKSWYFTIK